VAGSDCCEVNLSFLLVLPTVDISCTGCRSAGISVETKFALCMILSSLATRLREVVRQDVEKREPAATAPGESRASCCTSRLGKRLAFSSPFLRTFSM